MQSTFPSDFKNLTLVLSPLTDNNYNKKRILPYKLDKSSEGQKSCKYYQHIHITYFSAIFDFWKTWKCVRSEEYNFQGGVKNPTAPF